MQIDLNADLGEGFGRRVILMSPAEIGRMCAAQIGPLVAIAAQVGVPVAYVKPHGALGNLAALDRNAADVIPVAVQNTGPNLAMLAISGTQSAHAARAANVPVFSEVFADRGYLASVQLVPRDADGALIHDAADTATRLLTFFETGLMPVINGEAIKLNAQSICVHGDTAGAIEMTREIRTRHRAHDIQITGFATT